MANVTAYGRWLRQRREEVQPPLNRSQLSRMAKCSATYISRLEKMGTGEVKDPIENPSVEKIDDISRALERLLNRPLVNEARRILGFETTDAEPLRSRVGAAPEAYDVVARLLQPENVGVLEVSRRLLRMPPEKQAGALRVVEAIELLPREPLVAA